MNKFITSKENKIFKAACSLKESKYRKSSKTFLLEGKKALQVALDKGLLVKVFTLKELPLPYNIEQFIVPFELIKKLSFTENPEGVISIVKYPTFSSINNDKCLYLDSIQDPGNLGTIIRTSVALGIDTIYLSKDTCDPFNEKAVAASKGAVLSIPIIEAKFNDINENKTAIVSSLDSDSCSLDSVNIRNNFILVLGNEAHGVRKEIAQKCDIKVKIPMKDFESLNVAVAAGILIYNLVK